MTERLPQDVFSVAAVILASLGGGGALVFGLSGWLGKLWANRLMQSERAAHERELERLRSELRTETETAIERLRTQLGKTIHVHRIQFETEFQAYQEIWRALVSARRAVLGFRPIMDFIDPGETEEERKQRRLETFSDAFKQFFQTVENNRPFYPEEVWTELSSLAQIMRQEATAYNWKEAKKWEYWEEVERNTARIVEQIDNICGAIRSRVATLEAA